MQQEYSDEDFEEEVLGDDMDYGFEDPMDQEEFYEDQYVDNGRTSGASDSFMNKSPGEYMQSKKMGGGFNESILQTTANTRFTPGSQGSRR